MLGLLKFLMFTSFTDVHVFWVLLWILVGTGLFVSVMISLYYLNYARRERLRIARAALSVTPARFGQIGIFLGDSGRTILLEVNLDGDFYDLFYAVLVYGLITPVDEIDVFLHGKRIDNYNDTLASHGIDAGECIRIATYFGAGGTNKRGLSAMDTPTKRPRLDAEQQAYVDKYNRATE